MFDHLSPREHEDVVSSERTGRAWARVIRLFLEGTRLRLGWDSALAETDIGARAGIAAPEVPAAIEEAVRWAVTHRLHLLGWHDEDGTGRWFMAVG